MQSRAIADHRAPLGLIAAYLAALFLLGGSARPEALSQPAIRIVAILAIGLALIRLPYRARPMPHPALLLLAAITGIIALQLIPLPASVWSRLGGRALLVQAAVTAGADASWQPISMAPDFTENSLLATLPAWAMLTLFVFIPRRRMQILLAMLAAGIAASALLGLMQIATRSPGLYAYAVTNFGVATGLFANRNHEGLFLCHLFPLLAALSGGAGRGPARSPTLPLVSGALAALTLASLFATGSRGALLSLLLAVMFAAFIGWRSPADRVKSMRSRAGRRAWLALPVLLILIAAIAALAYRSEGIARLHSLRVADDGRVLLLRPMTAMIDDYLPFGVGFGAFPTAFLIDEPDANLGLTWLNHAHNDLVEMLIEGGAASAIVLAVFAVWYFRAIIRTYRFEAADGHIRTFAWLGASWIALEAIGGLFDYALRTPLMMSIFILAVCLLHSGARGQAAKPGTARYDWQKAELGANRHSLTGR